MVRVTDRDTNTNRTSGTVIDHVVRATVPCSPTGSTSIGSTCSLNTSVDSLIPGAVKEGVRAIWEMGQVLMLDGGEDGLASTQTDNTLFLKQGVFVP